MKYKLEENLKKVLESMSLSQTELARKSKTPISTLHGWLHGVAPSGKGMIQLLQLARYLDVSMESLLFGVVDTSGVIFKTELEIKSEKFILEIRKSED